MNNQELNRLILEELGKQKKAISEDTSLSSKVRSNKIKSISYLQTIMSSWTIDQIESTYRSQKANITSKDTIKNFINHFQNSTQILFDENGVPEGVENKIHYDEKGNILSSRKAMYIFKKNIDIFKMERNNANLKKILRIKENLLNQFNKNQTQTNGSN
jgi:hypothetical protein